MKSSDSGETWANTGLEQHVEAFALDPVKPGTLYAGTQSRVFKSTDGGASWNQQSAGLPPAPPSSSGFSQFLALAVSPQNPATVYAVILQATSQSSGVAYHFYLAVSTDAAATWTTVTDPALAANDLEEIAIDPQDPAKLYLGTTNGILKSTDSGRRWSTANSGLRAAGIGAVSADGNTILAVNLTVRSIVGAALFRSVDSGANWAPIDVGVRVSDILQDPQSPRTLYAWNGQDLIRSADAGATWSPVSSDTPAAAFANPLALDPLNPAVMYKGVSLCAGNCDNRVYKSTDAGRTWTRPDAALKGINCCSTVSNLAVDPSNSSIVYAGTADYNETGNGLWKSLDAGATWTNLGTGDFYGLAIDPTNTNNIYVVWNCCVAKSTDGGHTWIDASSGLGHWPSGPLVFDPADSSILYSAVIDFDTNTSAAFRTTDAAANWNLLGSGLRGRINALSMSARDRGTLYVGTSAGLFAITPGIGRRIGRR